MSRQNYDDLNNSEDEETSVQQYGKCTTKKSLQSYFRLKLRNRFVENQIKRIDSLVAQAILVDNIACRLFKKFLKYDNYSKRSDLVQYLDCYLLCDSLLYTGQFRINENRIQNLILLSPTTEWEEKIEKAIHHDYKYNCVLSMSTTRSVIRDLKRDCLEEIECHEHYYEFTRAVASKSRRIKHFLGDIYDTIE